MLVRFALPFLFFFHDWPQLLGPGRNGIYSDSDVAWPTQFAWQTEVGSGFAAPVIAAGKVILFHRKGKREIIEAFEASTGKTVWAFDYATNYRDDFGFDDGPRSPPTVADGKVFAFGAEGVLHALDLATGAMLWRVDVHKRYESPKGWFGAGCAPLVYDGELFLNIGSKKAGVGAFDPSTGKLIWPAAAAFGIVFLGQCRFAAGGRQLALHQFKLRGGSDRARFFHQPAHRIVVRRRRYFGTLRHSCPEGWRVIRVARSNANRPATARRGIADGQGALENAGQSEWRVGDPYQGSPDDDPRRRADFQDRSEASGRGSTE